MTGPPDLLLGEDLPPAPLQKRSAETRVRLKAAALALFGEKGYEGVSINEIASRAGLAVGGFYQHYRSKRQLLLALMDELVQGLSRLDLAPQTPAPRGAPNRGAPDPRKLLRDLLARAFAHDLTYLGAYRAWREAVLSDAGLARKDDELHAWTTARVATAFTLLRQLPGARPGVEVPALARVMDTFFWSLLAQAVHMPAVELNQWIDSSTHLIYHALFTDPPAKSED